VYNFIFKRDKLKNRQPLYTNFHCSNRMHIQDNNILHVYYDINYVFRANRNKQQLH